MKQGKFRSLFSAISIAAAGLLSGCTYGGIYAQHLSDPIAGHPFESAYDKNEYPREGVVNAIGIELRRNMGPFYVSQSLSHDFSQCERCINGGPLLYEARVGMRLFGSRQ